LNSLSLTRPPAKVGLEWLKSGFRLFYPGAISWMGMSAAFFLAAYGLGLIPWVGPMLLEFLSPFLVAAYMSASRAAEKGEPAGLMHFGAGLAQGRNALLVIGGIYLSASLLVGQIIGLIGGEALAQFLALAGNPSAATPEELRTVLDQVMPALLLGAVLFTPLLMATWFAPALVLFDGFPPGKALFWSLWACVVNWRPMLAYGLLLSLFGMVALLIPLGLGLLILLPVVMISTYAAYRDQFVPIEPG